MSYLLPGSDKIRVFTRRDWGARDPRALTDQPHAPKEAFLHHTYAPRGGHNYLAEQKQAMQEIQSYHMDNQGWSDVGYHFVVFQAFGNIPYARIFEGRDWHKIPAAQAGHNSGTLAVCTVGNFEAEELKRNTRYAIGLLLKSHPAGRALQVVGGHRNVVSTGCPGNNLYRWIPRIADAANLRVWSRTHRFVNDGTTKDHCVGSPTATNMKEEEHHDHY